MAGRTSDGPPRCALPSLEAVTVTRLLCRVTSCRLRPRVALMLLTAIIAAAATTGALLGFGLRAGTPVRGFNAIASLALSDRAAGVWGWDSTVTPAGIMLLVAMMMGWGVLFSLLAIRMRGWRLAALAAAMGLAVWLVTTTIVLRRAAPEVVEVLGTGQVAGLHVVLAVALGVGMRFARSAIRSDPQRRAAPQETP